MSDHHQCPDCSLQPDETKLLTAQAQGQLNMALEWLGKNYLEAAGAFVDTVR